MTVRTWHVEIAVVAAVLFGLAAARGARWPEWVGAGAVLASFGHAQIADRLTEREARRPVPAVECYGKAVYYFVAKEALWVVFFVATGAWSALVGCALFLLYPVWRRAWRARHPLVAKQEYS